MGISAADIPEPVLRLLLASGVGPVLFRRIIEHFETADRAVGASARELQQVGGIGAATAQTIHVALREAKVEAEREAMLAHDVKLVMLGDDDYPPLLAAIQDPPPGLWVRGELSDRDRLSVAIVGSRKATAYGREQAGRFAHMLAEQGLTIVSGGALGIDGAAHRAALRSRGRTIVVLGSGLAKPYPDQHRDLFDEVVTGGGAVISEYPMHTEPRAENFPRRNRTISGLALGVLVVEAGQRSGALITARLAAEDHGREVMVIPGRVDSAASVGALKILKEGWAAMVTEPVDVLQQLDSARHLVRGALEHAQHPDAAAEADSLFDQNLSDAQRRILTALRDSQEGVLVPELIAAQTGLSMQQLLPDLTVLQIRGMISRSHDGLVRLRDR